MPNWCYSTLEITGPQEDIKEISKTKLDFEKILPTPKSMMRKNCKDRNAWYYWRLEHWGVKWPAVLKNLTESDTHIRVDMETAWALPMGILKILSEEHPKSSFHIVDCEEESGMFVGSLKFQNGETIENNIHEPSKTEMKERGMFDDDEELEVEETS